MLQGRIGEMLAVLAPVCASWSSVNLGTSMRSILLRWGNTALTGVRRANKMLSRQAIGEIVFHKFSIGCIETMASSLSVSPTMLSLRSKESLQAYLSHCADVCHGMLVRS